MIEKLRQLFRPNQATAAPSVPEGTRFYVIGDIHGRLDLFEAMIDAIEADDAEGVAAKTTVVLLGDLVDRGPESAQVIARTKLWQQQREVRVLAGNHEEMFLQSFDSVDVLRHFLKHGGHETILSYGLSSQQMKTLTVEAMFELLPDLVSQAERDYIAGFEDLIVAGDYLFVHAGIDPASPIDHQKRSDLLWIRERFLKHEGPLEKVVVHGHTIFDHVMDCGNRIGVDTGAYRSGVLTALVLEGDQKRYLQTIDSDGYIEIFNGVKA